jgi:hypothetical protein
LQHLPERQPASAVPQASFAVDSLEPNGVPMKNTGAAALVCAKDAIGSH